MNPWFSAALVTGAVVLQSTLADKLSFQGVKPDLVLLVAITLGLLRGPGAGAGYGAAAGFLQDLLVGRYLGLHALTHGLVGGVGGAFERHVFKENPLVPLIACLTASVLHGLLTYGLLVLLGPPWPFSQAWGEVIWPAALYNALLGPLVYWSLLKVATRAHEPPGRS